MLCKNQSFQSATQKKCLGRLAAPEALWSNVEKARAKRRSARPASGFTLIELVTVIMILGILSIFVAPKLIGSDGINIRGFSDQTAAYLRYAQKTAVAQRRTVCVEFGASSVLLRIASNPGQTTCALDLQGPTGGAPALLLAKSGAAFAGGAPVNFNFDGLGQPVDASGAALGTQTISIVDSGITIRIEAVTGYVRD